MENLKIRVTTKQESKEAQELFFELGYKWIDIGAVYYKISPRFNYITAYCEGKTLAQGYGMDAKKEITLPQLKDMVVLKRNDRKDANVYQDGDTLCLYDLYLTESEEMYFYHCGKKEWVLSNLSGDKDYYSLLKPIVRETLNDKVASAEVARQELKGVDATLAERQSTYGGFEGVANITGQLMAIILNSPNGQTMPYAHEEALHMICSKIARIMNGDINHLDSWHDIGGYAKLIEDLIGEAS